MRGLRAAAGLLLVAGWVGCATARVSPPVRPPGPPAEARAVVATEPPPIKAGVAPPPGPYAPGLDALNYAIRVFLPDTGTSIEGRTTATIALASPRPDTITLDFTGLAVDSLRVDGVAGAYRYADGKLRVATPAGARVGDTVTIDVAYHGHPDDGLAIRSNVHGARTAFADDWPNRARFWFPCIDDPSDKATADIEVVAPREWSVVANGARISAPASDGWWPPGRNADTARYTTTRWMTRVPIPTYTMVIGAARFATRSLPPPSGAAGASAGAGGSAPADVSVWLFPEDTAGLRSFRRARDVVAFYSALVGPFPYEKLAHVESSTRFGGMENASAIFYDEKAIAAGANIEHTVAHETAHQWFGDAVTERDWHHLWLSEGFATYFDALFTEHADGEARFREVMERTRAEYLQSADTARPVIDPGERDLFALLNANNYDKGAWVLHMLRGQLGDSAFFGGIRRYYREHLNGNAVTSDLEHAMEAASGRELGWFFRQWLEQPGYPRVALAWRWEASSRTVEVTVRQLQAPGWPTFRFPLELRLTTGRGAVRRQVDVSAREQTFRLPLPAAPTSVTADPDARVLLVVESSAAR